MGMLRIINESVGGTFLDQFKGIIIPRPFDEHTVVVPGTTKARNGYVNTNNSYSEGVLRNGSIVQIPENTAAFIFNHGEIEDIITDPGSYEFDSGADSIFDNKSIGGQLFNQVVDRVSYGGASTEGHRIAYVNLREIRSIKFGTHGPQVYNDLYYGVDLEIYAYGSFSVQVTDPVKFVVNFVPPNVDSYSFDDKAVRSQLLSEFLQSLAVALNDLSTNYRISQLPGQAVEISKRISADSYNAGSWEERFGFKIIKVAIENIEFSDHSRELVNQFAANRMSVRAYDDVSQRSSNIAAQQKIAQGIQNNGLGAAGNVLFGANMAQGLNQQVSEKPKMSFEEQIETLKKLKELVDIGILSQEEFDIKKKEIMGL